MAVEPADLQPARRPTGSLRPFIFPDAQTVASWINPREAFLIAPRSRPPITAHTVLGWGEAEGERFMLLDRAGAPVAYGEVNRMSLRRHVYWLGHLVVDPARRRQGYGTLLTRLLLGYAFEQLLAHKVTLVVFPDNHAAISCYESAGMHIEGHETHWFAAYRRRMRLVRMAIERAPA